MSKCDDVFLLQNESAGYVGNSPVFWHKSGSGYTQWVDDARLFTSDEAQAVIRSTQGTHRWKLWTAEEIQSVMRWTVDIQDLRKNAGPS